MWWLPDRNAGRARGRKYGWCLHRGCLHSSSSGKAYHPSGRSMRPATGSPPESLTQTFTSLTVWRAVRNVDRADATGQQQEGQQEGNQLADHGCTSTTGTSPVRMDFTRFTASQRAGAAAHARRRRRPRATTTPRPPVPCGPRWAFRPSSASASRPASIATTARFRRRWTSPDYSFGHRLGRDRGHYGRGKQSWRGTGAA